MARWPARGAAAPAGAGVGRGAHWADVDAGGQSGEACRGSRVGQVVGGTRPRSPLLGGTEW